jgi:hypothetical protein
MVLFYVIREGEILNAFYDREEANTFIEKINNEYIEEVLDEYDIEDPVAAGFIAGYEGGYIYCEEIDLNLVDDYEDWITSEGDSFSKAELEEWTNKYFEDTEEDDDE